MQRCERIDNNTKKHNSGVRFLFVGFLFAACSLVTCFSLSEAQPQEGLVETPRARFKQPANRSTSSECLNFKGSVVVFLVFGFGIIQKSYGFGK